MYSAMKQKLQAFVKMQMIRNQQLSKTARSFKNRTTLRWLN